MREGCLDALHHIRRRVAQTATRMRLAPLLEGERHDAHDLGRDHDRNTTEPMPTRSARDTDARGAGARRGHDGDVCLFARDGERATAADDIAELARQRVQARIAGEQQLQPAHDAAHVGGRRIEP